MTIDEYACKVGLSMAMQIEHAGHTLAWDDGAEQWIIGDSDREFVAFAASERIARAFVDGRVES